MMRKTCGGNPSTAPMSLRSKLRTDLENSSYLPKIFYARQFEGTSGGEDLFAREMKAAFIRRYGGSDVVELG
ncbi:MAG: hypothetical protein LC131_04195, partial [Anaerolineae bacterium]|nr:hypothetical protein [Anaerolineae bacterium]